MPLDQYPVNFLENDEPGRSRESIFTLDGVRVTLRFFWNARDAMGAGAWNVDVKDEDGEKLIMGLGLALSVDIFEGYRYMDEIPGGQLFPFDTSLSGVEPGLSDFIDGRVQLLYRPAAEVV